jgi:hypothetical protein
MLIVALSCILILVLATVLHYEVLRMLSSALPRFAGAERAKLLIVMFAAFVAHALEILLYGAAYFLLSHTPGLGVLSSTPGPLFSACLYFSAETYTSLGFGDIVPSGPLRLLAGTETLNGLLLIGWSASFTYLSMEKFWNREGERRSRGHSDGSGRPSGPDPGQ